MMPVRKNECSYLARSLHKDACSLEKMNDTCYKLLRIQRNLYREKNPPPCGSQRKPFSPFRF